jgi:hypothetical protein
MYQLIDVVPGTRRGEPMRHRNGTLRLLKTGKAASKFAKIVSAGTGKKIQPRPFAAVDWKNRELQRLTDGVYQPLPWVNTAWWANALLKAPVGDHYAHVSKKHPGRVAYTESDAKGLADIQTPMKAGRYLQKFCGFLSSSDIAYWSASFSRMFENNLLQFATSREDIIDVYRRGPVSCMSHYADQYRSKPYHPTEVYASGDVAVAYMERDGRVTARCVCCPRLKSFDRVYGDYDRLMPLLVAEGYRQDSIAGARLLKIKHKGGFVMPYLDCGVPVRDMGDHFVIERMEWRDEPPSHAYGYRHRVLVNGKDTDFFDTCNTSGMTGNWHHFVCADCGEAWVNEEGDYCPDCEPEPEPEDCEDEQEALF